MHLCTAALLYCSGPAALCVCCGDCGGCGECVWCVYCGWCAGCRCSLPIPARFFVLSGLCHVMSGLMPNRLALRGSFPAQTPRASQGFFFYMTRVRHQSPQLGADLRLSSCAKPSKDGISEVQQGRAIVLPNPTPPHLPHPTPNTICCRLPLTRPSFTTMAHTEVGSRIDTCSTGQRKTNYHAGGATRRVVRGVLGGGVATGRVGWGVMRGGRGRGGNG